MRRKPPLGSDAQLPWKKRHPFLGWLENPSPKKKREKENQLSPKNVTYIFDPPPQSRLKGVVAENPPGHVGRPCACHAAHVPAPRWPRAPLATAPPPRRSLPCGESRIERSIPGLRWRREKSTSPPFAFWSPGKN